MTSGRFWSAALCAAFDSGRGVLVITNASPGLRKSGAERRTPKAHRDLDNDTFGVRRSAPLWIPVGTHDDHERLPRGSAKAAQSAALQKVTVTSITIFLECGAPRRFGFRSECVTITNAFPGLRKSGAERRTPKADPGKMLAARRYPLEMEGNGEVLAPSDRAIRTNARQHGLNHTRKFQTYRLIENS